MACRSLIDSSSAASRPPRTGPTLPANSVHDTAVLRLRNRRSRPARHHLRWRSTARGSWSRRPRCPRPSRRRAAGRHRPLHRPVHRLRRRHLERHARPSAPTTSTSRPRRSSCPASGRASPRATRNRTCRRSPRVFGYGTAITYPGQPLNQNGLVTAVGEEVLSPYWLRANTGAARDRAPAGRLPHPGQHGDVLLARQGLQHDPAVSSPIAGVDGQSVLPRLNGSATLPAAGIVHADRSVRHQDRPRVERPDARTTSSPTSTVAASARAGTTSGSGRSATATASWSPTPGSCPWTTPASTTTTTTTSTSSAT